MVSNGMQNNEKGMIGSLLHHLLTFVYVNLMYV
jgi:hypothetical protein